MVNEVGPEVRPWEVSGQNSEKAQLVRLCLKREADLRRLNGWIEFPQSSCTYVFGKEQRPLPIEALFRLWRRCEEATGRCPACGRRIYATGFGGLLAIGGMCGVCVECDSMVVRPVGGLARVRDVVAPYLAGSPFAITGMIFGAAHPGRRLPLVEALRSLGETDLPSPGWCAGMEKPAVSLRDKSSGKAYRTYPSSPSLVRRP